jgi:hypothetical protein
MNDLRLIESAVEIYAIENSKYSGATVQTVDWTTYLKKKGSVLYNTGEDLFGNSYGQQTVDELPKVPLDTWNALSDIAGTDYFSPYGHL